MKRIILIRHAKSSWEYNVSDLKRPLSNTGYSDAQIMSGIFNNLNINVETIFSSPAIRTVQTAQVFLNNIKKLNVNKFKIDSELYDFQGNKLENFIKNLTNELKSVMIFSHNNSCNNFFSKFSNINGMHVPTCGILIFEFDVSLWKNINSGKCNYYFPKNFK
ncbi:histidine phosphatase family protein [Flavobacteriaceae bacterium]|nr:histidine phosphatase family protein [Flavobacteriaceae bacterium]MDB4023974.1 histidine phosphatase family protein [Flavobacteriaceae bacterium]MDB4131266.1 histidine phosphatase family protein [Flavobacteriaceae bacterium]